MAAGSGGVLWLCSGPGGTTQLCDLGNPIDFSNRKPGDWTSARACRLSQYIN